MNDPMKKWLWKMEYCKEQRIPPGQDWAWDEAEREYYEVQSRSKQESEKGES
jgi:hypothetical protein